MHALELVREFHHNAVVSSLQVAESFEKRHDRVLRAIDSLLEGLPKNGETPSKMRALKSYFPSPLTRTKKVNADPQNRHFKRRLK